MVQGTLEKSPQQVCRFYIRGRCTFGNNCKFSHTTPSGDRLANDTSRAEDKSSNAPNSTSSHGVTGSNESKVKPLAKVNKPCWLWQGGSCKWGDKCRFRHDAEAGSPIVTQGGDATPIPNRVGVTQSVDTSETNVRPAATQMEGRRQPVNKKGFKSNDQAAAVRRERQKQLDQEREARKEAKEKQRIEQRRKQEEDWAKEATFTIQRVVLNSFVRFEAGLTIQHVICGFEASQILIKNLPLNAQRSEIIALFTQQGVDPNDLVILKMETVDGRSQATVLGRATDVGVIAVGLDGIEFRDENLEFVVCERTSDGRTMGSSSRDFHLLTISYPKPSLTMVVRYPDIGTFEAGENKRKLDGKILNGQRIRAEVTADGFDEDSYLPSYAIELSRIPADTTVAEVQTLANTRNVELRQNALSYKSDDVFNAIESHLRSLPGSTLQRLTPDNSSRPNFVSVKAFFNTWESAKSARDSLSGKFLRLGFPSLRVFLSDPYRFVLTLDENQYNSQKAQWSELCEGKRKEVTIQTRTVDRGRRRSVIITLFGRDKKMVGALKVRIEGMAAGQRLDASYWHPVFKDYKYLEFFDDLYHSTGAYFRSDWKHNRLTASGSIDAVEAAKARIKDEIDRIVAEEWTIPLQRRALGFFIREGLAKMKGLLGEENVALDVNSAKIVLHGADLEEARHHLRQLMDTFMNRNASSSSNTASDENPCPVCYDNVLEPFEIGCQHIYCSSCLRHYILSAFDNHSFPLKCMGNDATCNQPLSLPLIQRFLPHQRFETLMEAAFRSYIDKNPETFKYCNTPDCSQVYRATTSPQVLQCPSCFAEVCTACYNEGHTGMTCAERRVHKDAGEQERLLRQWATESGVKRCPSCQAWVEKTAGCNHMSWVFESNRIYDHMSKEHGGFYNDPEPRVNAVQAVPNNGPDIVDVVGGPAAAAEQMAAFRRIEAERAYRVQPPANGIVAERPARPFVNRVPAGVGWGAGQEARRDQPLQAEAERRRREIRNIMEREEARRTAERRREEDRQLALRAQYIRTQRETQQAGREEVRRREAEARRRETQENKGWCTIM
ncbi:hypothetical protein AGABI1DRAFT_107922 [Agaricus bisporus var. burnettii JB137-S8]|uniref:RBR-type E3 ubiquitin transferase n=1 Tax=Agaricus bisporus var. burnettii (strain JB137-S8 / ATCC MYA-4627 / FGSC 10392) TaxID=597362 RepID=K5X494_AGABU|nr:uncharacterized protein AGABI1DRAFT_107922 [Agaricus bisporus var. burnettii JB137-S8]EKM77747.1 hypothetical protein AGABI1DRAFT_107922 [Agaricus bisporus var. burnettii JB137-S8]